MAERESQLKTATEINGSGFPVAVTNNTTRPLILKSQTHISGPPVTSGPHLTPAVNAAITQGIVNIFLSIHLNVFVYIEMSACVCVCVRVCRDIDDITIKRSEVIDERL